MNTVLDKILDWPVIVQGAVGSALFSLILYLGQKTFVFVPRLASKVTVGRRRSYLHTRLLRLHSASRDDLLGQAAFASALCYRALRDLFKALIWLTLGLLFTNFVGVWGVVGYLGCLYYLFFALEVVKPITVEGSEIQTRIQEIKQQIAQLESCQ